MRGHLFRGAAVIVALSLVAPRPLRAQAPDQTGQPAQTDTTGQPPAPIAGPAPTAPPAQAEGPQFSAEQLDALLAPIALYPDALLAQILMASTYPLQVVEASRWYNQLGHDNLQGDALAQALEPLPWDPSVKSLVPFPQVVAMLNTDLDWMQQLGYAFATQQADVMNAIQRLRHEAQASGTLRSSAQQNVVEDNGTIGIEPANPTVVYVPVYNPTIVYGAWPSPDYQPVYIPPPFGYLPDSAYWGGFGFGTGVVVVGSLFGFARLKFHRHEVHIDKDRFNQMNRMNVNRTAMQTEVWRPPPAGVTGRPVRPPMAPVVWGPGSAAQPANVFVRPNVQVPAWQMNRGPQPAFQQPAFQFHQPVQPIVRSPVNQVNRPMQPVMRPPPPASVQRPAVPQHGGPQQRQGAVHPSEGHAFAMH
jgi:hypothetical protein